MQMTQDSEKKVVEALTAPFCPTLEYGMDPIPLFALLRPKPRSCEQSGKALSQHPNRNDHLRDGTCTSCWESQISAFPRLLCNHDHIHSIQMSPLHLQMQLKAFPLPTKVC